GGFVRGATRGLFSRLRTVTYGRSTPPPRSIPEICAAAPMPTGEPADNDKTANATARRRWPPLSMIEPIFTSRNPSGLPLLYRPRAPEAKRLVAFFGGNPVPVGRGRLSLVVAERAAADVLVRRVLRL